MTHEGLKMEHIDLTNEPLTINVSKDREFDEKFLGNAVEHLLEIRNNAKDYITSAKNLMIEKTDNKSWELWIESEDEMRIFKPTPWALQQTIRLTELPKKYHDTLIEKNHIEEAVSHLNMWLNEGPNRRIRTVGDTYRAIVSPGYNPFDNYDAFVTIAQTIKTANSMRMPTEKPIKFHKAQLSDQNMYIQIIDEGSEWDLGRGDTYKKMMIFKNSEVGDGAMIVEAALWRYMCRNLQIHGIVSRRIHKGEKLAEGIFAPDTMETQNELWKKILRDSLNTGIASNQMYDEIIHDITESKDIKIEPIKTIEKVQKKLKLTDNEKNAIINAMMGDTTIAPDEKNTLFQLTNGMTSAAKEMGIERGIEIQRMAGDIKTLIKEVAQ
jgi:hypothetical protein